MTGMPIAAAWSLVAALLLQAVPLRVGIRALAIAGLLSALATLLLALAPPLSMPHPASRLWLGDRLSLSLAVVVSVPGVLVAAWRISAATPSGPQRHARECRWPVAAQLVTGGAILACRASPLFLMLVGVAILLAGVAMLMPRHRDLPLLFASLLLTAWLGIATLSAGLGHPASWTTLMASSATVPAGLRLCGLLLLLPPMFLLAWLGTAGFEPDLPATSALLPVPMAAPGLLVALRLRALAEPDPGLLRADILVVTGLGLLGLLVAVALMAGRRQLAHRLRLAAAVQLGAAAIGIGVGGTAGVVAGLMILLFLALALPVALLPVASNSGTPGGRVRLLAVLAVAGLPPFGLFAAGFVLLLRLFAGAPVLALLVLAGFAAAGWSLVAASMDQVPPDPPSRLAAMLSLLPGVTALALLLWLGLAMPEILSNWLLGVAEASAGAVWPTVAATP